jgi:hypothetical protein
MNKIISIFNKVLNTNKRLEPEVFDAYLHRLPGKIRVDWRRDGKYIIGEVTAEENKFMTQGRSGEEFVEMVNDAVYTMYDVPEDYRHAVRQSRAYNPSSDEQQKLEDVGIKSSAISFSKSEKALRTT